MRESALRCASSCPPARATAAQEQLFHHEAHSHVESEHLNLLAFASRRRDEVQGGAERGGAEEHCLLCVSDCIVRSGFGTDSQQLGLLEAGTLVDVMEYRTCAPRMAASDVPARSHMRG